MEYAEFTDKGSREINEDYIRSEIEEEQAIFALADGLGGHGNGDLASQTAVDAAVGTWRNELDKPLRKKLEDAFCSAQKSLLDKQNELGLQGKARTTLVLLMVDGQEAIWGHIGDSRLYRFKGNRLQERTLDHSVPQMLVNAGELKEKKIRGHVDRSTILRALGTPDGNLEPSFSQIYQFSGKESFLLCSDGFWEQIVEKDMEKTHKKTNNISDWMTAMTRIVRHNGKNKNMDNNSAIGIMF